MPVVLHAETVPGRDGSALGLILTLEDRREAERTEAARVDLDNTIAERARLGAEAGPGPGPLLQAILTHARLAGMDIAEASAEAPLAPVLAELSDATRRAADLLGWLRKL